MSRTLVAEALGTALLLAAVVGSGIMAERLAGGNVALALLANTLATGAALAVLISILGPVSGAHFNPAVTLYFALRGEIAGGTAAAYVAVQVAGGIAIAATFGLIATVAGAVRFTPQATAYLVALYITAAYWFTASTSFANPAVTIARAMTDSFAGIAPSSAPGFIAAQLAASFAGFVFCGWMFGGQAISKAE